MSWVGNIWASNLLMLTGTEFGTIAIGGGDAYCSLGFVLFFVLVDVFYLFGKVLMKMDSRKYPWWMK